MDETANAHFTLTNAPHKPPNTTASQVTDRRELFWTNVVRDALMALATAAAQSSGRLSTGASSAKHSVKPIADLFDGRMAVITTLGQRIAIADIFPVFAATAIGCEDDIERSQHVQCTVFRITTPQGEIFTLPISQIISIHSLSDELLRQLEQHATAMSAQTESEQDDLPFGFAAYTTLAKSESDPNSAPNPQTS